MATYEEIIEDIRKRYGRTVKTCWIAHVKEMNGLPVKRSPHRLSPTRRAIPCPPKFRSIIEDSMKHLGMLDDSAD